MTCDIAVSIINFRTADLTINCVKSVLNAFEGVDGKIIVVDNFSGDGSAEEIAHWIDEQPAGTPVRLVLSQTNSGFSGGHNQGIVAAEAKTYLVLNSDAVVQPDFFTEILTVARANPKAGFIVPRLQGEDDDVQANCFRFPGPASEFMRGANSGPVTRLLKSWEVALPADPDPDQIEWASFACILLNGDMVRELKPMDEGYFLYFEDAEYCLRARRAGWGIIRAPKAVAIHFRGGSGPVKTLAKLRKRLPSYYYSSRTRFLYQSHGRLGLWTSNVAWILGRSIAALRRLGGRPSDNLREGEGRDIWINVMRPLGPRCAPGE
jgi:N-acetylglucosaminyl-diphospho-decaprenol L-rhamnosyltransferase